MSRNWGSSRLGEAEPGSPSSGNFLWLGGQGLAQEPGRAGRETG